VPGANKVLFGADFRLLQQMLLVETYSAAVAKVCEDYGNPARLALEVDCRRPPTAIAT
jgi:hypothetical protein